MYFATQRAELFAEAGLEVVRERRRLESTGMRHLGAWQARLAGGCPQHASHAFALNRRHFAPFAR
jgi:hypothetical protein